MKNNRLLRSTLFIPSYLQKYLDRVPDLDADAVILDLEDSVPQAFKARARDNLARFLSENRPEPTVLVRVNAEATGMLLEDLDVAVHPSVDAIMFTKIQGADDIRHLDRLLAHLERAKGLEVGRTAMLPLVETATAVIDAHSIASASPRLLGLAFGAEDYLTELDGLHTDHGAALVFPRSRIVVAARAAGIAALDTPYLAIDDLQGLTSELRLARELGFSGALLIHPSHVRPANEAFSPSRSEILEAETIFTAIRQSEQRGLGVARVDGNLVGPPMRKRAEKVLEKAEAIARRDSQRTRAPDDDPATPRGTSEPS